MLTRGRVVLAMLMVLTYAVSAGAAESWQTVTEPVKIFQEGYIQVTGTSEEGQTRYKAVRAATVIAQRDLLEIMQGLSLFGATTVKDGMLHSDHIKTTVNGVVKGAQKCGEKYDPNTGHAEVCMKIYIRGKGGMFDIILPLMTEEHMMPQSLPSYEPKMVVEGSSSGSVEKNPVVTKPSDIGNPHDGLIIDAGDYSFRPALVNRIITQNNEVIFDPSKIVSSVLVDRGCGGFTNSEAKAKALLSSWGSKNPMYIKAKGVSNNTDIQIDADGASAIFTHDKKGNFLAQANVVFIVK
jgi:hypothetical protein